VDVLRVDSLEGVPRLCRFSAGDVDDCVKHPTHHAEIRLASRDPVRVLPIGVQLLLHHCVERMELGDVERAFLERHVGARRDRGWRGDGGYRAIGAVGAR
jgi:hypothetical protein